MLISAHLLSSLCIIAPYVLFYISFSLRSISRARSDVPLSQQQQQREMMMPRRASFRISLSLSLSLPRIVPVASIYIIYEELSLFARTRFSKAAKNNKDVKCFSQNPLCCFVLKLPFFKRNFSSKLALAHHSN